MSAKHTFPIIYPWQKRMAIIILFAVLTTLIQWIGLRQEWTWTMLLYTVGITTILYLIIDMGLLRRKAIQLEGSFLTLINRLGKKQQYPIKDIKRIVVASNPSIIGSNDRMVEFHFHQNKKLNINLEQLESSDTFLSKLDDQIKDTPIKMIHLDENRRLIEGK